MSGRVAVAGLGAVGLPVARALASGSIPGLRLAAVSASTEESGRSKLRSLGAEDVPVLGVERLAAEADVVVEGLPPSEFLAVAEPTLRAGRTLVALSVTQILRHRSSARPRRGGRIVVPTGALIGLDAVRAAAEGGHIRSVVMRTKKPPKSLQNAPFVKEQNLDLSSLTEPLRLYEGSVRAASKLFPANVNVACALALAGVGPDETQYEIWADPGVGATRTRAVVSDESNFEMSIAGVPSAENPATGALTPLSAIATLRGLVATLKVGT
ncbi:serine-type peptidase [Aureococcus anophagefferens]|nr:serine-type peptidase [Aureococcus anophagefferens]